MKLKPIVSSWMLVASSALPLCGADANRLAYLDEADPVTIHG